MMLTLMASIGLVAIVVVTCARTHLLARQPARAPQPAPRRRPF
ncbi:hypothetical protein ACFFWD_04140 [Bradyrhizobium erythrophlei]